MIPTKEEWQETLIERHGEELYNIFKESTVAVCGLGGLGSNIAISLARAGVGRLILIDFDRVDISNLHRQQYKANQIGELKRDALIDNLKEIAPYTTFEGHEDKITPDNVVTLLDEADVICEAFDAPEEKAMLLDAVSEQLPSHYLVGASGVAGTGSPNGIKTRRVTSKYYLCGDEVSGVKEGQHLIAPCVALCAAHQAQVILRLLAGETEV